MWQLRRCCCGCCCGDGAVGWQAAAGAACVCQRGAVCTALAGWMRLARCIHRARWLPALAALQFRGQAADQGTITLALEVNEGRPCMLALPAAEE